MVPTQVDRNEPASTTRYGFSEDKIDLIKRQIAKGATDDELEMFLIQCQRTGLDPFNRQIYFQKYQTRKGPMVTIITGIDGYRSIAHRTGTYAGIDPTQFDDFLNKPKWATVTVYKVVQGMRCPFTATARWDQYFPSSDEKAFLWKKMPHLMLEKCAEALALRKAFPSELSGIYTPEEMDQAGDIIDVSSTQIIKGNKTTTTDDSGSKPEIPDDLAGAGTSLPASSSEESSADSPSRHLKDNLEAPKKTTAQASSESPKARDKSPARPEGTYRVDFGKPPSEGGSKGMALHSMGYYAVKRLLDFLDEKKLNRDYHNKYREEAAKYLATFKNIPEPLPRGSSQTFLSAVKAQDYIPPPKPPAAKEAPSKTTESEEEDPWDWEWEKKGGDDGK